MFCQTYNFCHCYHFFSHSSRSRLASPFPQPRVPLQILKKRQVPSKLAQKSSEPARYSRLGPVETRFRAFTLGARYGARLPRNRRSKRLREGRRCTGYDCASVRVRSVCLLYGGGLWRRIVSFSLSLSLSLEEERGRENAWVGRTCVCVRQEDGRGDYARVNALDAPRATKREKLAMWSGERKERRTCVRAGDRESEAQPSIRLRSCAETVNGRSATPLHPLVSAFDFSIPPRSVDFPET